MNKVITLAACLLMTGCTTSERQFPAVHDRAASDCAPHEGVSAAAADGFKDSSNNRGYRVVCNDGYIMQSTVGENE